MRIPMRISAVLITLLTLLSNALCQGDGKKVDLKYGINEKLESSIVDGFPAVRFFDQDGLNTYDVQLRKSSILNGDAFIFPVMVFKRANWNFNANHESLGYLYIGRTKICFLPFEGETSLDYGTWRDTQRVEAFCVSRTEIKNITNKDYTAYKETPGGFSFGKKEKFKRYKVGIGGNGVPKGDFFPFIAIKGEVNWTDPVFEPSENLFNANKALVDFQVLALTNFDDAVRRFEQFSLKAKEALAVGNQSSEHPSNLMLFETFYNSTKTDPDIAFKAASVFIKEFPKDEKSKMLSKWIEAYKKVKNIP